MKKHLYLVSFMLVFVCLLSSCVGRQNDGQTNGDIGSHTHSFGEWEVIEAPTCTDNGFRSRYCSCGEKQDEEISAIEHTIVIDAAVNPTCTDPGLTEGKRCSVCSEIVVKQTIVDALGHIEVIDDAVESSCINTGLTEGSHCSACGKIFIEQKTTPAIGKHSYGKWLVASETSLSNSGIQERICTTCGEKETRSYGYHGSFGYDSLASLPNGSKMQELYNEIDYAAVEFHSNPNIDSNIVAMINFDLLELTDDEALAVWSTYKNDHPLYYWFTGFSILNSEVLVILTDDDYYLGADRAAYNQLVYDGIDYYFEKVSYETSPYQIALAFHDTIIYAINYAYEEDGRTPQDDAWAHNILGVFEKETGVCEAYARAFQLLLNYSGVENTFVTGKAGEENHAWNLAKMDDGNWYWFDLTWDDTPGHMWGVSYNYFCVNDIQDVGYLDGWIPSSVDTFSNTHICSSSDIGINYLPVLPVRSNETIINERYNLSVRNCFKVDEFTFAIAGYNTVQLVEVASSDKIIIPDTVTFEGRNYEVISIGIIGIDDTIYHNPYWYDAGSVLKGNVTYIYIPRTVKFIWDFAVHDVYINEIDVAEDNPYFTSENGVLFTKNLYTLIQYPLSNEKTEYVVPEITAHIARGAFSGNKHLSRIVFGKNVQVVGKNNWGYGYRDEDYDDFIAVDVAGITSGELDRIYQSLHGEKELVFSDENPYFYYDKISVYSRNPFTGELMLMAVLDKSITSLHLPANVRTIYKYQDINKLENLETITVDILNEYFFSYDGILYSKDDNNCKIVAIPSAIKTVSIYDGLKKIDYSAFRNHSTLTSIIIPDSIATIGDEAFRDCTNLKNITIGNGITSIGSCAFYGCTSLTSINIPNSVTSIETRTFYGCTSLASVTIGNSVTSIGEDAFDSCTSLAIITIPNGVTSIGENAFSNCINLTSITIPNSVTSIGGWAFGDCTSLTIITIPNSVTSIGQNAFEDCTNLTNINLSDNVTRIGYCAFDGCTSLTSINIPDSVTSIEGYAFKNCTSLTSITIPSSVTSIGQGAFDNCTSLTSINIPDSVSSIENHTFDGCTLLESIIIGNSVTNIGAYAFNDCTSLTSITIPNGVTSIGENAFSDCINLTSITIPNSVSSIGEWAFRDCTSLTSITIPNGVTSIGFGAFERCTLLTDVYYTGNEKEWAVIEIYHSNDYLTNATIHYNYVPEE